MSHGGMFLIFGVPAGFWAIGVPVAAAGVGAVVVHVSERAAGVVRRFGERLR